jgi:hypothetical protein
MSVRCSIALAWCSNCGECSDAVSDFRTAVSGCTGAFAQKVCRGRTNRRPRVTYLRYTRDLAQQRDAAGVDDRWAMARVRDWATT